MQKYKKKKSYLFQKLSRVQKSYLSYSSPDESNESTLNFPFRKKPAEARDESALRQR